MNRVLAGSVVVITGASSGIGRETALRFGSEGAHLVLAARNRAALDDAAAEVERTGGEAHVVPTDVSDWDEVHHLATAAVSHFGRIDTWVNNAAVSLYAPVEQTTAEEMRRIVEVDLLGQMYGCAAALEQMKRQGAGTIINVASALALRSVPLQAAYCASKHGVKGFTEALRMELQRDHPSIRVTLVLPSSINTPLFSNARSKMGVKPMPIPPIYEPGVVADAIVVAARRPLRDITVGGSGKILTLMERLNPGLVDWYMLQRDQMFKKQLTDQPDDGVDNLFAPLTGPGSSTGDFGRQSKSTSVYTRAFEQEPVRRRLVASLLTMGLAALATRRR